MNTYNVKYENSKGEHTMLYSCAEGINIEDNLKLIKELITKHCKLHNEPCRVKILEWELKKNVKGDKIEIKEEE